MTKPIANLLFCATELQEELSALQSLADQFLDRTCPFQLKDLGSDLKGLMTRGGKMDLQIPKCHPLKTRVSIGEFERSSKKSKQRVFGTITGIWEVERVEYPVPHPSRPNKKRASRKFIGFTGKSSTTFNVTDEDTETTVASWKMELGDSEAPGCFFHTFSSVDHRFPVPRHPNLFATPMSAIGFALSELFQDKWEEAVSGNVDAPNRWRSIQSKRFQALLKWQLEQVSKTSSSPWISLKRAKPNVDLFL